MPKQQEKSDYEALVTKYFPFSALNGATAHAVKCSGEIVAKSAQTLPQEVGEFIGRRARTNAFFYDQCTNCKDFGELVSIHRDWWKQVSEDYAEEANQMISLGQSLMTEAANIALQLAEEERDAIEKSMSEKEK